ncbi:winged helix DNA-binding protein [uncultured Chryseobacterium sp.]|uniref:MarR family winged helix-turn-helix transcriptional regulator n=1 Tax=uncultured Chryseobacterium sp. TaxID=259322 RepID=UPI00261001A0|nr:winged helix DNA-binding protein [uncultured Chryseobacterium sp.]
MDFTLLKNMISELEIFSNESKSGSMEDFRIWLNKKAYEKENPRHLFEKHDLQVNDLENEICKQILLLNRFAKQMIRKGLANFPQLANEEFTYLYRLADYDSLTKMQLVEKNGHEKQTGIEIIKRLIKNGLVEEYDDAKDKRTKRVKITEAGMELFKNSTQEVTTVAKILSADLTDEEKATLLISLKKLNDFHFTIYHEHKDRNITDIVKLTRK